ncbi:MAG TPA: alpha/beta fold hydrolase [Gemmatimonadales bacterium]|jgi:proline iminopeptidase|nr:alpha/beta fold hydrolase [Gemmatimonadales bacterium]
MNPAVTEAVVRVNGVSLFTRSVGSGPDVIVLHGGPGAHHDYLLPHFDLLATGRRLRYYDQRGGGRSPVGRDTAVGWREQVADLDALITHWTATPATLLGYSWGGLLALLYAVHHPDRVGRLALVSPAAASSRGRAEFERRFAERGRDSRIVEARQRLAASGLRETDPEAHRKRVFELAVAPYFRDPERARDLTPFRVTGRTQDDVWRSLGEYDFTAELEHLRVPALVMHGRHDPIPLWCAEDTARRLNARLVVLDASGHVAYVEETARFVSELDHFLPRAA